MKALILIPRALALLRTCRASRSSSEIVVLMMHSITCLYHCIKHRRALMSSSSFRSVDAFAVADGQAPAVDASRHYGSCGNTGRPMCGIRHTLRHIHNWDTAHTAHTALTS